MERFLGSRKQFKVFGKLLLFTDRHLYSKRPCNDMFAHLQLILSENSTSRGLTFFAKGRDAGNWSPQNTIFGEKAKLFYARVAAHNVLYILDYLIFQESLQSDVQASQRPIDESRGGKIIYLQTSAYIAVLKPRLYFLFKYHK